MFCCPEMGGICGDMRVTLDKSTGEIDLPIDSSDWLEVIAWSKQQLC